MPKKNKKKARPTSARSAESRTAEAITIAWTVTLTTLLFCHVATLAAHWYVVALPEAKSMRVLREMLLFAGAVVGALSLLLLPFVQRLRLQPPPFGLVVFGTCLAAAPVLVLTLRALV